MNRNRKKQILITVSLCLVFGGILLIVMLIHVAGIPLESETRSWATSNTCVIITRYITESQSPRWPTNWDDLASITYTDQQPYWPEERAYYEENVSIDFEATLRDVAAMTREDFDAVVAVGANYGFRTISTAA